MSLVGKKGGDCDFDENSRKGYWNPVKTQKEKEYDNDRKPYQLVRKDKLCEKRNGSPVVREEQEDTVSCEKE